jgi:hypothetical protein
MKHEFSYRFSKNLQTSNVVKIRPVGAEYFLADRRTEMTKLILANDQLDAQILCSITSLLQSSTSFEQSRAYQQEVKFY